METEKTNESESQKNPSTIHSDVKQHLFEKAGDKLTGKYFQKVGSKYLFKVGDEMVAINGENLSPELCEAIDKRATENVVVSIEFLGKDDNGKNLFFAETLPEG